MSHVPIFPARAPVRPLASLRDLWRDRSTRRWILAGAIVGALLGALVIWFAMGRVPCCTGAMGPW